MQGNILNSDKLIIISEIVTIHVIYAFGLQAAGKLRNLLIKFSVNLRY